MKYINLNVFYPGGFTNEIGDPFIPIMLKTIEYHNYDKNRAGAIGSYSFEPFKWIKIKKSNPILIFSSIEEIEKSYRTGHIFEIEVKRSAMRIIRYIKMICPEGFVKNSEEITLDKDLHWRFHLYPFIDNYFCYKKNSYEMLIKEYKRYLGILY